jgi:translation initiation factor 2 alpha subunit (eIF-2alpha)
MSIVSKKTKAKNKKPTYVLPDWIHKIKLRFYENIYPEEGDIVIAKIKRNDENVGYYMDLIEYDNKEALIVFKEVARSSRINVIRNTFNNDTNYPLVVNERYIHRQYHRNNNLMINSEHNESLSENIQKHIDDYEEIDSDEEVDFKDESVQVNIDLTNRGLSDDDKKEAMKNFNKYKQVHTMLHTYGFILKQNQLTSQEEANNVKVSDYKQFLEQLAKDTIWKYSRNEIYDIIHSIRDDLSKLKNYFELDAAHEQAFKLAICKSIVKTKYHVVCHIKMQTLEIGGIDVLKTALENISKSGINVQVISAPEYLLKMDMDDIDKIKDKMNQIISDVGSYMSQNLGFVQVIDCNATSNNSDELVTIKL